MRTFRMLAVSAPLLMLMLSTSGLFLLAGCDSAPAPGAVASPVDKDEAAKQNQGIEEFYKSKPKGKTSAKQARKAS